MYGKIFFFLLFPVPDWLSDLDKDDADSSDEEEEETEEPLNNVPTQPSDQDSR